jgi:hypothetical protein
MTICVAAIVQQGAAIVAASDSMMSWGASITSETSLKFERLHKHWALMLAGDDIHPAEPIIRELRQRLNGFERPTLGQVEEAIRSSWRVVKNRRAETHVLSAYDLTMNTFIVDGRDLFGEIGFAELRGAIDRASELTCELLVYGFDEHSEGALFVAVHPGEPVNFTRLGFAAIGSGRDSAIASLMWDPPHKTYDSTIKGTYRVTAAKFMAETALGVGRGTTLTGLNQNGEVFVVSQADIQKIRSLWESKGRPRIPTASELVGIPEPEWSHKKPTQTAPTAPDSSGPPIHPDPKHE